MLSPREIPMRVRPAKPKILTESTNWGRYGGQLLKHSKLSSTHVNGRKRVNVGHENPYLRRMRELHTVEIRDKWTKELVDLEVSSKILLH